MKSSTSKYSVAYPALLALVLAGCGGGSVGDDTNGNNGASTDDESSDHKDAGAKKDSGSAKADASAPAKGSETSAPKADAGSSSASSGGPKGVAPLPCDVQKIITSNCSMCHGAKTQYGAPMSLVTADDFTGKASTGTSMADAVKARINETDPKKAMPPSTGTKLTTDQLATLNKWLASGAKSGDACSEGSAGTGTVPPDDVGPVDETGLDCFDFRAHGTGTAGFGVGVATDAYYNFTFTAPWKETAYGITFEPLIDNTKAIHHFLFFQNDTAQAATGAVKSSGAHPDGQLLFGWAPGGQILDFRKATTEDVGFELSGTVSYTLEFHYNSSDPTAVDASGMRVCTKKTKPANIAGISWLGYDNLLVPSTSWEGTCTPENSQPVHILGVQPHMHVAGTHMKGVIHRKGGGDETLHDEPFDFNDQRHYLKNVVINQGDSITTTCTYDQPMSFGESTGAEMCYLFTFAYPKGQLKDSGPWGGVAHGGSACLGQ